MNNIIRWCAKKDNMKIIIMVSLALVLIFVLIHRFSGREDVNASPSSESTYESNPRPEMHPVKSYVTKKKLRPAPSATRFTNLNPPPFLTRDIFSFRQSDDSSSRESDRIIPENLELNATIIDKQGSLAMIGDEVLGIGDFVKGLEVTDIKHDEVIVSGDGKKYILRMTKE